MRSPIRACCGSMRVVNSGTVLQPSLERAVRPATAMRRPDARCRDALSGSRCDIRQAAQSRSADQPVPDCTDARQGLAYESDDLLALTAFVARQSNGLPIRVKIDGPAAPYFERGKTFFHRQAGSIRLSCAQCHVDNAGKPLRGDTISHAVPSGYPIYRLAWQSLGSLHRRLRSCSQGVRAIRHDFGSQPYLELELYLAARARGVRIETPAIRR